jgi:hypothetical protein
MPPIDGLIEILFCLGQFARKPVGVATLRMSSSQGLAVHDVRGDDFVTGGDPGLGPAIGGVAALRRAGLGHAKSQWNRRKKRLTPMQASVAVECFMVTYESLAPILPTRAADVSAKLLGPAGTVRWQPTRDLLN